MRVRLSPLTSNSGIVVSSRRRWVSDPTGDRCSMGNSCARISCEHGLLRRLTPPRHRTKGHRVTEADPTMAAIGQGIELNQRGERDAARQLLAGLWERLGPDGDPLHRCAIAHSMADTQDDPHDELAWDLLALEAAESVTDGRVQQAGMPGTVAGFYPSLHLNLGDVYRRLGNLTRAREHLALGRAATDALADDGYARMIRSGLDRLDGRGTLVSERVGNLLVAFCQWKR